MTKTKQTFKWAPTCARHTGKPVEIGDAWKWGEGGENINRTGGIQHTSDPDIGSLCNQLKNSRKATVCYKHCPNSYEGIDIS